MEGPNRAQPCQRCTIVTQIRTRYKSSFPSVSRTKDDVFLIAY
jgi:hypothetical protein